MQGRLRTGGPWL